MDAGVGSASGRAGSAAPVRRQHLLSRANDAGVLGPPVRTGDDDGADPVGRRLPRPGVQPSPHRGPRADRMDHEPGRPPLDWKLAGCDAERIADGIQRVHAHAPAGSPGSPLRVLSPRAARPRPPAHTASCAVCADSRRLVGSPRAHLRVSAGVRVHLARGRHGGAARDVEPPNSTDRAAAPARRRHRGPRAAAVPDSLLPREPGSRSHAPALGGVEVLRRTRPTTSRPADGCISPSGVVCFSKTTACFPA